MNRDSRLKPLVETGTGSIGEADESGGREANRPRTGAIKPLNTPVEEIGAKPDFVPTHKLPVWLSSEDVKEAILELGETGVDKAACWDFMQAIYRLVSSTHLEREGGGNG